MDVRERVSQLLGALRAISDPWTSRSEVRIVVAGLKPLLRTLGPQFYDDFARECEEPRWAKDLGTGTTADRTLAGIQMVNYRNRRLATEARDRIASAVESILVASDSAETAPSRATDEPTPIDVFISHSSKNLPLLQSLVGLLTAALNVPKDRIRCTSVDGCRLLGGAPVAETLRHEIAASTVFLAVLTPEAAESGAVLIELGARWGLRFPLLPLVGPGATFETLPGWLRELNALRLSRRPEVQQMLEETAKHLSTSLRPGSAYQAELDTLLELAQE